MVWHHTDAFVALAAEVVFGVTRGKRGRPAGLRTVTWVRLATCVVMLQTNWLLGTTGKKPAFFVAPAVSA
ncbi:hypothetical protein GOB93_19055 [Acetobacter musti]|uniref:Transposase n=1 Tax=Acetobacter musti TaxID=864732 RepID=A0ABX0JW02_9PROT|nr:hypothetical protein [Acetobacter musti]NHN86706.1 hypothetical protein [Acetobacter musti]